MLKGKIQQRFIQLWADTVWTKRSLIVRLRPFRDLELQFERIFVFFP